MNSSTNLVLSNLEISWPFHSLGNMPIKEKNIVLNDNNNCARTSFVNLETGKIIPSFNSSYRALYVVSKILWSLFIRGEDKKKLI